MKPQADNPALAIRRSGESRSPVDSLDSGLRRNDGASAIPDQASKQRVGFPLGVRLPLRLSSLVRLTSLGIIAWVLSNTAIADSAGISVTSSSVSLSKILTPPGV